MSTATADKSILILQKTEDGELLAPQHLYLIQIMSNAGVYEVTEQAEVAFEELYQAVLNDRYSKPWFHGIEHLTQDHEGYIYWKGVKIEHYSYAESQKHTERESAFKLAERCRYLEMHSLRVSSRNLMKDYLYNAPEKSPWLQALCNTNSFLVQDDPQCTWVIVRFDGDRGTAIGRRLNEPDLIVRHFSATEDASGWYHAYMAVQSEGAKGQNTYGWDFNRMVDFLTTAGFSPDDVWRARA